ncbi:MAG: hypothetical protein IKN79_01400 [Eubacterium sp.]|nr:hypothetical protein [Eubacterium sp.]
MKKRIMMRRSIFIWTCTMILGGIFAVLLVLSFSALAWAKEDTGEKLYSLFVEIDESETGSEDNEDMIVEEWILYANLEIGERYYLEGSLLDGEEGKLISSLQKELVPRNRSGILILRYSQNKEHSEALTTSACLSRIQEWPEEKTESGLLGTAISRKPAAKCAGKTGKSSILNRVLANLIKNWVPVTILTAE